MGCLLISSKHVESLIDTVIEDTKKGMGFRLYDLAGLLESIAEAQDDPILHVLPQAIGGFGNILVTSRSLIALPMLPDPLRTHLTAMINASVKEAVSSLDTIRKELCVKDEPDHKMLMSALGGLFKQSTILAKECRSVSPRRQPAGPLVPTEEE
jgi:hypothetical protein